jgi:hypothetical protein
MPDLREDILKQITEALDDVFADLPGQSSEKSRRAKADHLSYAENVLNACTAEELRSEAALEHFLETTVRNARAGFYNL